MSADVKRAFTREEAAVYTGLSIYKIKAAIRENRLPAYRETPTSKDILVRREDLDDWINSWGVA